MAKRAEIAQRKQALLNELRDFHGSGQFLAGSPVPPVRELSEKFNLSTRVISQELEILVSEGVLNKVPNVGTFFGRPRSDTFEFYLLILPREIGEPDISRDFYIMLQMSFDERIAQLGGTCLTMTLGTALAARQSGALPPLSGVFNFGQNVRNLGWQHSAGVPHVCFEDMIEDAENSDVVGFDNESGGRLAAGHLIHRGHRRIAFLAGHNASTAREIEWSAQRETGWRVTLQESDLKSDGLALHPDDEQARKVSEDYINQRPIAQQIAAAHLGPRGLEIQGEPISALVTFNDAAAMGVLAALRAANTPHHLWPVLVGFDNAAGAKSHVLTSLRLPWEEVGRVAADLLWERSHHILTGTAQHRSVAMRLIPRLTCHSDWSLSARHSALTSNTATSSSLLL